jgi:Acyl-coenzyme A synthetases/AMP-(fatty) acid ligases
MEIWRPQKEHLEESNVARFMTSRGFVRLEDFINYTAEKPEFWALFEREVLKLRWYRPYDEVVDMSRGVQWPRWFVGGRLNIADQLDDSPAPLVKWEGEDGSKAVWSYADVLYKARAVASWLKRNGLEKGDRVAVYMPMVPEIVPVMLGVIRAGGYYCASFQRFRKGGHKNKAGRQRGQVRVCL